MFGSARAQALVYSAVKLFSKNSNLCDHGTYLYRQTDGQTTCNLITALCVASRGQKQIIMRYWNEEGFRHFFTFMQNHWSLFSLRITSLCNQLTATGRSTR